MCGRANRNRPVERAVKKRLWRSLGYHVDAPGGDGRWFNAHDSENAIQNRSPVHQVMDGEIIWVPDRLVLVIELGSKLKINCPSVLASSRTGRADSCIHSSGNSVPSACL